MSDISSLNLKEPDQLDWDNFNAPKAGGYAPPPVPIGPDQRPIPFTAQVVSITPGSTKDGYRSYQIDAKLAGGNELRTWINVKQWKSGKTGEPMNLSSAGMFLRSCGVLGKPQTNADYDKHVLACRGRNFSCNLDWRAYNADTQEQVDGFMSFPEDPERPGQRKAILKQGDVYTVRDKKGNVIESKTVKAEVLFANPSVARFIVPGK